MEKSLGPTLSYRLRTVRIGIETTLLALVVLIVFRALPGSGDAPLGPFALLVAIAALGALGVALLPWHRLFETEAGIRWQYAWSWLDITLVTMLVAVTGGGSSELWPLYVLTTVFFAASYPRVGQLVLLVFTIGCYAVVAVWVGETITPAAFFVRFGLLGTVAFMSSFLSKELMDHMTAAAEARVESDHRAELLATVAGAAREMSVLGDKAVFDAVVDAAVAMDFEAAELSLVSEDGRSYEVFCARGVPDEYRASEHDAATGVTGMVLDRRQTVVVSDYAHHPRALAWFAEQGFRLVVASPIFVDGHVAAVMSAGSRSRDAIAEVDVEAFELLTTQAGRALESVRRFEAERGTVERLSELDRLKTEFLTLVSHELRTPLTTIEGMGLTLDRRWEDLDEVTRQDFLKRINESARNLAEVVSKLLDFSSLEAGSMQAKPGVLGLRAVVDGVLKRLGRSLEDHHVAVDIRRSLRVVADRVLLDRVLDVILSNAVQYTPPGTRVMVQAILNGDLVDVSIEDDGPGIERAELDRVGERFFRGGDANSRAVSGAGLGLAMAREMLALHGASLEVSSRPGAGTIVSFSLSTEPTGVAQEA